MSENDDYFQILRIIKNYSSDCNRTQLIARLLKNIEIKKKQIEDMKKEIDIMNKTIEILRKFD